MQAGISEIYFPKLSLEDFFAQAKEAGYDTVELVLGGPMPLQPANAEEMIPVIRALSQRYGLPVVSLVQWQCTGNLLASGEEQSRSIAETCRGLEIAAALGATVSLHTLGTLIHDIPYEGAYENAVASLQQIAPTAEATGVALAVEFVWNGFLFSPLETRRLLEAVDSPAVGFYFAPGNMAIFQYPHHWVRALGPYIKAMHAKDWTSRVVEGSWRTPGADGNVLYGRWTGLLEGDVDFPAVMAELRRAGYDGAVISEVEPSLCDMKTTEQSIRKILAL